MTGRPRYPNQQLRAVSVETFFRGRVSALARMEGVQARFDDQMPNLFVPTMGGALHPFHLRPADGSESLSIAVNQASYTSYSYPGHEAFIARALELVPVALEIIGVTELLRVVYRYENTIAITPGEGGVLPIEHILRLPLPDGGGAAGLDSINLDWSRSTPSGGTGVKIWVEPEGTRRVLRFNVAAKVAPAGWVGELAARFQDGHDAAVALFERLITDQFRAYIQGVEP